MALDVEGLELLDQHLAEPVQLLLHVRAVEPLPRREQVDRGKSVGRFAAAPGVRGRARAAGGPALPPFGHARHHPRLSVGRQGGLGREGPTGGARGGAPRLPVRLLAGLPLEGGERVGGKRGSPHGAPRAACGPPRPERVERAGKHAPSRGDAVPRAAHGAPAEGDHRERGEQQPDQDERPEPAERRHEGAPERASEPARSGTGRRKHVRGRRDQQQEARREPPQPGHPSAREPLPRTEPAQGEQWGHEDRRHPERAPEPRGERASHGPDGAPSGEHPPSPLAQRGYRDQRQQDHQRQREQAEREQLTPELVGEERLLRRGVLAAVLRRTPLPTLTHHGRSESSGRRAAGPGRRRPRAHTSARPPRARSRRARAPQCCAGGTRHPA